VLSRECAVEADLRAHRGACYNAAMLAPTTVIALLRPDTLRKLLYTLLLLALVPLGEILLMAGLGALFGTYLVLAAAAAVILTGCLAALRRLSADVVELRRRVAEGEIAGGELESIAGTLTGVALLLCPGFVTDVVGLAVAFTSLRWRVGAAVIRFLGVDAKRVTEYLRLGDGAGADFSS